MELSTQTKSEHRLLACAHHIVKLAEEKTGNLPVGRTDETPMFLSLSTSQRRASQIELAPVPGGKSGNRSGR